MRTKFIATGAAAALLLFAASSESKPINSLDGCAYTMYLSPTATYAQTFKPTFSVLKNVRLALFEAYDPYGEVSFRIVLKDGSGALVAASEPGMLRGANTHEDASAGAVVTFRFADKVRVTPGQTYALELERISGDVDAWACTSADAYADGYLMYNDAPNLGWDFDFAVSGSGPPN